MRKPETREKTDTTPARTYKIIKKTPRPALAKRVKG